MFDKKIDPYRRYGIKCQKCGERIWLEYRVYNNKKEIKSLGDFPRDGLRVKFCLNTKQNKELLNTNYRMEYFINYYWKHESKKSVRRLYGTARSFREKSLLCNKCIKLERLKE